MKKNFLIGQISDTHYVSSKEKLFDKIDTHNSFLRTIDACNNLDQIPDIYILSGDLIHDIEIYYHDWFNLCKKLNNRFEIIFINDCSTDNTWSIIQKITKKSVSFIIQLLPPS